MISDFLYGLFLKIGALLFQRQYREQRGRIEKFEKEQKERDDRIKLLENRIAVRDKSIEDFFESIERDRQRLSDRESKIKEITDEDVTSDIDRLSVDAVIDAPVPRSK